MSEDFAGTFSLATPTGAVTVELARGSDGRVTGTMTGSGSAGAIQGTVEKDLLTGTLTMAGQGLHLRARRDGPRLVVEVAEFDLLGQPAWATARVLTFDAATPAGATGARNPFAPRAAEPAADPLAGAWQGAGIRLALEGGGGRWQGRLEFAGAGFPVEMEGAAAGFRGILREGGQAFPFAGRVVGAEMQVQSAQGEFRLQRAGGPTPPTAGRNVTINGVRLGDDVLAALEQGTQVRIGDGEYWYDRACGAWGVKGGPMLGAILAGLELGGPLVADASGGGTGVFINGRELHPQDVLALQRLGPVMPGRYWVDGFGNGGFEGGPAMFNLVQLAQRAGGRGGPWSHHTKWTDAHVGGDGQGFSYYIDKDVSWSSGG